MVVTVEFKRREGKDVISSVPLARQLTGSSRLLNPDEVILTCPTIRIKYDYPLNHPVVMEWTSEAGFTRLDLFKIIVKDYYQIYDEEKAAVGHTPTMPGSMNRARSHGPYGIWGHYLGDLELSKMVNVRGNLFRLEINS